MPPSGRRSVSIGPSLARALKARAVKGNAQPKSLHSRDFHSFRYNFKPSSVDPSARGKVSVKKFNDATTVSVERPSTQPGETYTFTGSEIHAKEWECVLIYDDSQDTYTLEKLDSHTALNYERKPQRPEIGSKASNTTRDQGKTSHGTKDNDTQNRTIVRREEEEPEEGEVTADPVPEPRRQPKQKMLHPLPPKPALATSSAPPPSQPTSSTSRKAAMPVSSVTKLSQPKPPPSVPTAIPPPAQTLPFSSGGKKHKRDELNTSQSHNLVYADEEVLEFGKPAKPAKRNRKSPTPPAPSPPRASEGLALPGTSNSVTQLPAAGAHSPPVPSGGGQSESEEEEWDEIAAVGGRGTDGSTGAGGREVETEEYDIFGDDEAFHASSAGVEDELERQLDLQMAQDEEEDDDDDDDEDFLKDAVEEVGGSSRTENGGGPISLKAFAAGDDYESDDDSSTSDSDDD